MPHSREKIASVCFEENIRLFAGAKSDHEKYNLYKGLSGMCWMLEQMLEEQRKIGPVLEALILEVQQRRR